MVPNKWAGAVIGRDHEVQVLSCQHYNNAPTISIKLDVRFSALFFAKHAIELLRATITIVDAISDKPERSSSLSLIAGHEA